MDSAPIAHADFIYRQSISVQGSATFSSIPLFSNFIAAAASEPEANERGSSLISRRLHHGGLQSLFLTKRKDLWLCASERFRMRSGMPQGIVVMREWEDLGCSVVCRKELWLCANRKI